MSTRWMRCLAHPIAVWLVAGLIGLTDTAQGVVDVRGFISAGAAETDAATSWRTGQGFGVLDSSSPSPGSGSTEARGDLHLVIDGSWQTGSRTTLGAFLHLTARTEPDSILGEEAGVVEAYLEARWQLRQADQFRVQLGHFFLPTSRENVSWAWSSPYTLTFSAINTWIGEEVRPTGLLLEYRAAVGALDEVRFGASAFGGNDTTGTLLAWRGWALSDRLTVWDEVAPLPPVPALAPGGAFDLQRDDGTLPMATDLDGRTGYAGWLAWNRAERAHLQATYYDNRADRGLWRSGNEYEYAWDTRFWQLSAEAQLGRLLLAAEWIDGTTGMGRTSTRRVDADFEAAYLLTTVLTDPWLGGTWRFTTRWDEFETVDIDRIGPQLGDDNDSQGDAFTAAIFWEWLRKPLRIGLEYLDVDSTRDQAAESGFGAQVGGEQIRVELRYFFGR